MAEPVYSDLIAKHYNYTGKYRKVEPDSRLKADSVVFIIVCCFIIMENVLVLLTIWRTKKFHKPMYYFIGNLALSDLLAGVVYTANILLSGANTYKLTPRQWFFREGSMFVALAASVFSLLAIAIERHLTMLQMKLHNSGKACRVFLLISAVWMVAGVLGGLPVGGWNCIDSMGRCSTVLPLYHKTYILFCTSVFSILLMAVVVLYARIYALVRTRSRQLVFRTASNGRSGSGAAGRSSEKSLALLRTVVVVLSCFIACWAPLFVLLLLDVGCQTKSCPVLYQAEWFLALAVLNSAMNPLIYTLTSKEMRRAFLKTLLCCTARLPHTGKVARPITGAEFSRSKSDNSSHPNKEEGESSHPNKEEVESSHPNKEEVESSHPNKEEVESSHPNKEEGESSHPNKEEVESSHPNKEEVESSHPNKEERESSHPNKEEVESSHPNKEERESSHPNKEEVESSHPNKEERESSHPNKEERESSHPNKEEVESSHPNKEEVESSHPNKEEGESSHPNKEEVESSHPNKEEVESSHPNKEEVESSHPNKEEGETNTPTRRRWSPPTPTRRRGRQTTASPVNNRPV